MPSSKVERKLAAIMFTDIAGYTEQMSKDENIALQMLRKKRSIIKPLIDSHKGIYVKEIGDGTLSYFESGYNASACAKELQRKLYNDELNIKVGIHIGDIVFDDEDVYGDGVNIASRIETLAPAGGVLISKNVYDELINKDNFEGIHLGLQSLKGVGRLVDVYAIKEDYLVVPKLQDYKKTEVKVHKDDEVPSIAIIPFENKGKDEDSFYAYGISADLISDISSASLIRVPSLKRVEEVADLSLDEKAAKLDVCYTVEGTLWKMEDMFQLSIELYNIKDKKVVWSDRWEEKWDNLPSIKGSLSDGLLKALDTKPKVEQKIDTTNTEAYEFYLKAKHKYEKRENTDDTEIARGLVQKAIDLDGNLIVAKFLLGTTYEQIGDFKKAMGIYNIIHKQAVKIGDEKWIAICFISMGRICINKLDNDKALDYLNQALEISEKLQDTASILSCLHNLGNLYDEKSKTNKALEYLYRASKIAKKLGGKREMAHYFGIMAHTYAICGDLEKELEFVNRADEIMKEIGYSKKSKASRFNRLGFLYWRLGYYDKSLHYFQLCYDIYKDLGDEVGLLFSYNNLGIAYWKKGNYKKAEYLLNKSLLIQNKINYKSLKLFTITHLYLMKKHLNEKYDIKNIYSAIKETEYSQESIDFSLYQLLDDISYLEIAFNKIKKQANNLEPDVAAKFLSYPIPKAIVEEWDKVKSK